MKNGRKQDFGCHLHRYQKLLAILVFLILSLTQVLTLPAIDPKIDQTLHSANETNIVISFHNNQADKILDSYDDPSRSEQKFPSRGARITAIHKELSDHANKLHEATLQVIKGIQRPAQKPYIFVSMWPSGDLLVRNADKALMQELSKSHEIANITQSKKVVVNTRPPPEPIKISISNKQRQQGEDNWGVKSMGFPKIWDSGNKGKGVVVGVIDSGVNPNHESLKDNFRSHYGWFEPTAFSKEPYARSWHGTSVASIVVGNKNEIGCAPEAQWIACIGLRNEATTDPDTFNECLKFMNCPTDTDGKNPRCDLAPRVIIAALGYEDGWFRYHEKYLKALRKSKIPIIFPIGNNGGKCLTANYPASSDLGIGVGTTRPDLTVDTLSSCGPPVDNYALMKPDVVAPGWRVLTAYASDNPGPEEYATATGSSVSAPHVAGLAAIYFHDFPNATGEQFEKLLRSAARPVIKPNGLNLRCGGISESTYPNYCAGYGLVDAAYFMDRAHGRNSAPNHLLQSELILLILISNFQPGLILLLTYTNYLSTDHHNH